MESVDEAQRQMIQQDGLKSAGSYAPPQPMHEGSIVKLTDPTDELHEFELSLRSAKENDEGTLVQFDEPLLNDAGINFIIGRLRPVVSRVGFLSNIDEKHVDKMCINFYIEVVKKLAVSRKTYNIGGSVDTTRSAIIGGASDLAFLSLRRAWKGDDKRFFGKTVQDIRMESVSTGGKKSLFSNFNPFQQRK